MKKCSLVIKWDREAWDQLQQLYEYIAEDSQMNALKVRHDIVEKVDSIVSDPLRYGADKFKKQNDGTYRYFELHHYRIAFRITKEEVKILPVRSTYQEPLLY